MEHAVYYTLSKGKFCLFFVKIMINNNWIIIDLINYYLFLKII